METFIKPPWGDTPTLRYVPWTEETPKELLFWKEQIQAVEATRRWELAKKMANPCELVYTGEDPSFHPSISAIKPLSRSYFKLIEILTDISFFESHQLQHVISAHLAEGPGGFLQAFLEMAEKNRKHVRGAYAMTLRPTNSNIPGWKRASMYLQKHPEITISYGRDGTGDMYNAENRTAFAELVGQRAHLYTADGGFDFSVNYNDQEQAIFRMLVASFLVGLRVLAPNGVMIVKLFDMFSEHTRLLVGLVGRCFGKWMLCKPATSRSSNSERYFVGVGFRGCSILGVLEEMEAAACGGQYPVADILTVAETAYMSEHIARIESEQIESLQRAMLFARKPSSWYTDYLTTSFKKSLDWCRKYHIPFVYRSPQPTKTPLPDDTSSEGDHPR